MTQQLQINPKHDPDALGQILQKESRLQVADFFTPDTADYLHKIHMENENWYLAYNEGSSYFESSVEQLQALTPQQ